MRGVALVASMLLLAACGDSDEEVAADFQAIAEATCFLNGFNVEGKGYQVCVRLISKSLAAQGRRKAEIEMAMMRQQAIAQTINQAGEALNESLKERKAARSGEGGR